MVGPDLELWARRVARVRELDDYAAAMLLDESSDGKPSSYLEACEVARRASFEASRMSKMMMDRATARSGVGVAVAPGGSWSAVSERGVVVDAARLFAVGGGEGGG